jgi:Acetyltransferase (GNAT) domain
MAGGRGQAFVGCSAEEDRSRVEESQLYQVREVRFDQDLSALLPGWKECNARAADHTIVCDPEWLQERYKQERADLRAYLLERDGAVIGAAAFEFSQHRVGRRFGSLIRVPNLPVTMARLLGYTPNLPAQEAAHDLLFQRLLSLELDTIYMTCIKADSFFWHYLHSSPLIRRQFRLYSETGLRPHPYLSMIGPFDDYMRKFSSKDRNNYSRRIRKLREQGEVELVRVTEPEQIDSFVEAAAAVSRKTYQYRALGIGIRNPDRLKQWLKWVARQGWLRSYLLKCGGAPCAFQLAYQYQGTFLGVEVGYDPAWSKLGIGITQQLLALEDLFQVNRPDRCDFGAYAEYKQLLANEAYADALIWLFRRRPYPLFALHSYRLSIATSQAAGGVLRRLNLKSRVKRLLRKQ